MSDNNATQNFIEEEGIFRATPLSWTFEETKAADSKAASIVILFGISQRWHPDPDGDGGSWSAAWPEGYATKAYVYVIGRNGTLNAKVVEGLVKAGVWNGDWDALKEPPQAVTCILDVQSSVNPKNGRVNYRPEWINPNADAPKKRGGGLAPVEPDVVDALNARFGAATRAIGGQQAAAVAPPTPAGAPPPPPAPVGNPVAVPAPPAAPPSQPAPFVDEQGQPESPPF